MSVSSVQSADNNNLSNDMKIPDSIGNLKSNWDNYRSKNLSMEKVKKTTGSMKPWQKLLTITFFLIILSIILVATISDPAKYRSSFGGFIVGMLIYCFIFICFYYISNFIIKTLYKS